MSVKLKKYIIGVICSLSVAGVIGGAGWMTSLYNRVYSLDCNSSRTNEILLQMAQDNKDLISNFKELAEEVKSNTGIVIREQERNNEQDRRLADHQRQIEHLNRKNQGG